MSFLENPIVLLFLTLAVYACGLFLSNRFKWLIFNPILLSMAVLMAYLVVLDIPYETYQKGGQYIDFFLKPSIVALAVPLYLQWERIKKQWLPIFISQLIGCLVGIVSVLYLAKWTGADRELALSLVPKSVSTPIALEVSATIGGIPSITATAVIITGIFGSMLGFQMMEYFRLNNPISQGIAIGTSSHALGTMKAMSVSQTYGAFASVGMIFNGVLTAVLAPLILSWLGHWF